MCVCLLSADSDLMRLCPKVIVGMPRATLYVRTSLFCDPFNLIPFTGLQRKACHLHERSLTRVTAAVVAVGQSYALIGILRRLSQVRKRRQRRGKLRSACSLTPSLFGANAIPPHTRAYTCTKQAQMSWLRGLPDLTLFRTRAVAGKSGGGGGGEWEEGTPAWFARLRCAALLEARPVLQGGEGT